MNTEIDRRLVELETRIAFQEHALAELSDALAASRIETTRTADLLQHALDDLKQVRGTLDSDPSEEPPPPHY